MALDGSHKISNIQTIERDNSEKIEKDNSKKE